MRICFYNPQVVSEFGVTLFSLVFEESAIRRLTGRFNFLLEILRDKRYEAAIVVDGTATSIPISNLLAFLNNRYFLRFFSFFEIYFWCLVNGINPFKIKILFSLKKLDSKNDILFGFAFIGGTFFDDAMTERSFFKNFEGKKVLHASHYFEQTKKIAGNVKKTNTKLMIAEANLKNSDYFNKYFGFIDSVGILPFRLRNRYVSKRDFLDRKNKCVALGTFWLFQEGDAHSADHFAHFKVNTLHPMRKVIVDNRKKISHVLDSFIGILQAVPKRSKAYRILKLLASIFKPIRRDYYRFDIVDTYNSYRMFVAPEENIGLPSVNSVEGMACGCAYLGLDSPMYADFGFKRGVHYIAYNGTLEDLVKKIEYYQARPDELEKIAAAGRQFVVEQFQEKQVIDNFLKTMETL